MLQDESSGVRAQAISSLGEIGAVESLPRLRELYSEIAADQKGNRDHRYRLVNAMKALGDKSAVNSEITRLGEMISTSENERTRGGALRTLMYIGKNEPGARAIFEQLSNDSSEWIRREAKRALGGSNERTRERSRRR